MSDYDLMHSTAQRNRIGVSLLILLSAFLYGCSTGQGSDLQRSALSEERSATSTTSSPEPQKLTWQAPSTREDGSSLLPEDIRGYKIYYKKKGQDRFQSVTVDDPLNTSLPLDSFPPGVYLFAISTIAKDGLESQRSAPIEVEVTRQ